MQPRFVARAARPILGLAFFLSAPTWAQGDSAWMQLFNGKDLADWDAKITTRPLNTDPLETFKVVDGILTVDYSKYTNFKSGDYSLYGHLGYKVRPFSHYILRVEYQVFGNQVPSNPGSWALQNNGLMLHSQAINTMSINQDFPISLETQLLGSGNGTATNLNLCTPGTAFYSQPSGGAVNTTHCVMAASNPRPNPGVWAWATISVMGDSIIRHYNGPSAAGTPAFTYYRPVHWEGNVSPYPADAPANGTPLKSGYIAIQSESHAFRFRKIEVLDLEGCMERNSPAYRAYFVKHKASACTPTSLPGSAVKPSAYRLRIKKNGLHVEGPGRFSVQILALDGTRLEEHQGEKALWIATRHPGLRLVRIRSVDGLRTVKTVLP